MKYFLKDYAGKEHPVLIPEGTTEVAGIIVSGDEILVYPVYRDPMYRERMNDFVDGPFYKTLVDGIWVDKEEQQ